MIFGKELLVLSSLPLHSCLKTGRATISPKLGKDAKREIPPAPFTLSHLFTHIL